MPQAIIYAALLQPYDAGPQWITMPGALPHYYAAVIYLFDDDEYTPRDTAQIYSMPFYYRRRVAAVEFQAYCASAPTRAAAAAKYINSFYRHGGQLDKKSFKIYTTSHCGLRH